MFGWLVGLVGGGEGEGEREGEKDWVCFLADKRREEKRKREEEEEESSCVSLDSGNSVWREGGVKIDDFWGVLDQRWHVRHVRDCRDLSPS